MDFEGERKAESDAKPKVAWVNLLLLHSCLIVAHVALQADRTLNTRHINCDVDKVTVAYECKRFLREAWRI